MTAEIIIKIIAAFIAAYLLSSIPSAYIMGRLTKKIDIRTVGSHNMGAMNSFTTLGKVSALWYWQRMSKRCRRGCAGRPLV